jgi:hypothetical protein
VTTVQTPKKSYSEKYYHLSEEEIQALIVNAKLGDGKSQARLLEVFDNFISKYCSLLFRDKYDLHDYDIRRFIALFITNKLARTRLLRDKVNPATYREVQETMRGIKYMIHRYNDDIDVRQTVQMTFLQCVTRYQRKGSIPFSGFLYSYFFYLLKKNVDFFLIDQLGRKTFPLITEESSGGNPMTDDGIPDQGFAAPSTPSAEDLLGTEEVDEYWVLGETALFPFDKLTVQQRQLIKWRFVDNMKASVIAKITTEHPNTVRSMLVSIRKELEEIVREEMD